MSGNPTESISNDQIALSRKRSLATKVEARWCLIFISPWLIGFVIFTLGPMLASLYFSFTRFTLPGIPEWVGLGNYIKMFTEDDRFSNSMMITFLYAFITVPVSLVLGFFLAYLLNIKAPFTNFWRTLYYMPAVITPVITGTLFLGLFDPRYGLVNYLLGLIGIVGPEWFLNEKYALFAVMLISLWGVGGGMIIYLAGLQSIPTTLYEAADLDGCNRWQRMTRITIPMMTPIIFYNLVIGIIGTFQLFTQVWVLTKGGPHNSTEVFNIYLYKTAFEYQSMGYASAMAWILFLVILILTALVFRSSSHWVYYENEAKS